jgi:hypothetical protein
MFARRDFPQPAPEARKKTHTHGLASLRKTQYT